MKRKALIGVLAVVLAVPTSAQLLAAPKAKKVVTDPAGDANALNDQGLGDGSMGDNVTPADASTVTDLLGLEISNDAKNVYVLIGTETAPPATQGVGYRVRLNPKDGSHCIVVEAFYPGAGNALEAPVGQLRDTCAGKTTEVNVLGPMIEIPRKANKAFRKGATLKAPQAHSFIYLGGPPPAGAPYPVMDTTKVGKSYKLVDKKK